MTGVFRKIFNRVWYGVWTDCRHDGPRIDKGYKRQICYSCGAELGAPRD